MNGWATLAAVAGFACLTSAAHAAAGACPNGGTIRFGVEPDEASAKLTPIYDRIGALIGKEVGCKVQILITSNYTAEIEAMRAGKLEVGEFGPLGYVLAHQVAKAQAVATFGTKAGKPDTRVKALYAGTHGASFEALRNHKVQAGELNSEEIDAAKVAGSWQDGTFVELWRSDPMPVERLVPQDDASFNGIRD